MFQSGTLLITELDRIIRYRYFIKAVDTIYVFEFKMSATGMAEDALAQIDTKDYLIPYSADGRKLVKIGAEFDDKECGISRWKILSDS